jgi:hypothetical protein
VNGNVAGAHDLILNILNPDLSCRATLTDIASHRWLQEAVIGPPSRPLWFDARSDSSCRSSNDGKRCSFDDGTSFRKQDWIEPDGFSHYAVNGLPVNHTNYGDYTMDGFLSRYNGNCYNGDTHRTVCSPNRYAPGGVGQFDGGDPMWRSTIADNDAGFGYESAIVAVDDSRIANARPPVHVTGYRTQLSTDNDDDDCQLVTSFIGPDCHGISGAVDGAQGSPASPPSIASCSSNDAPALRQRSLSRSRTYSADSLELHDCAFVDGRIEADALRCSASEDDNSNSVDECNCSGQGGVACSTCYDFADIDAVLDCLVNKETVGVDGYSYAGSQLSCDSLD